jgi:beta-glucosidase
MQMVKKVGRMLCMCVMMSLPAMAQNIASDGEEAFVEQLLSRMTLEEKIGQLTLYTSDYDVSGPFLRAGYLDDIKAGRVGAIFNAFTAAFTRKLQTMAVEQTRLKVPLLFGYDVIHGFRTIFPIPLGEAASWDLAAIEKSARIAATEASAAGLHWTFAPMVDIARDPRWGRIAEGAGEDTYLGSLIARARVQGFQGQAIGRDDTLLACAKHFAAYGAAEAGRDYNSVDISERTLREVYLPPFQAAVDAGAATIMTSFNEISGIPSTGNRHLLTDILRNEWKFQGFVVTDYTSINEMINHGFAANEAEAGELAINSGVDMDMQGAIFQNELAKLVAQQRVSVAAIDAAVRRILRLKYKLGLFANPFAYSDETREKTRIMAPEHLQAAFEMAKKAIVLLKNDGNLLPLAKNGGTIALIGPLADNRHEPLGSWCGAGDWQHVMTIRQGLAARLSPGCKLLYAKGCNINDTARDGFAEAVQLAQQADVIVAAMGEEAIMSGEAASRANLNLPGVQEELLRELKASGKPVVLILMNGRPLTIPWAAEHIPAIVECWFLGTQSGHAIAEVLLGDYNPSGRLPVSFPRTIGQIPVYYNHKNTGRPLDVNNKYTSKYLDVANSPLYPFGFGLSYTRFSYANLTLNQAAMTPADKLVVSVEVKNCGERAGTETVQLYLRDEFASVTRPVKELKKFCQITLQPGESQNVAFALALNDLSFYDRNMQWTAEPGTFVVMVGANASDLLSARFELRKR